MFKPRSMFGLMLFVGLTLYAGSAYANKPTAVVAEAAEVTVLGQNEFRIDVTPRSVVSMPTTWSGEASVTVGWNVHLLRGDGYKDSPKFLSDAAKGGPLQPQSFVVSRDFSLGTPDNGYLVFQLRLKELHGYVMTTDRRYYFRIEDNGLVPVTHKEYVDSLESKVLTIDGNQYSVFVSRDSCTEVDDAIRNLPPWDNPELSEDLRKLAKEKAEYYETKTQTSAMTIWDNENTGEYGGCSNSGGSTDWKTALSLIVFLGSVLILKRKRSFSSRAIGILAVCLISTVATSAVAETRTVYGYLSFWDTRSDKSDAEGSILHNCDTTITACTPMNTYCCFSGLPRIQVWLLRSDFTFVDMDSTWGTSGLFMISDTDWQDMDYYLVVKYVRALSANIA